MALWFDLMVNRSTVARIEIRRITNIGRGALNPGDVSRYLVCRNDQEVGYVVHTYGDGPYVLVTKATQLVSEWLDKNGIGQFG